MEHLLALASSSLVLRFLFDATLLRSAWLVKPDLRKGDGRLRNTQRYNREKGWGRWDTALWGRNRECELAQHVQKLHHLQTPVVITGLWAQGQGCGYILACSSEAFVWALPACRTMSDLGQNALCGFTSMENYVWPWAEYSVRVLPAWRINRRPWAKISWVSLLNTLEPCFWVSLTNITGSFLWHRILLGELCKHHRSNERTSFSHPHKVML